MKILAFISLLLVTSCLSDDLVKKKIAEEKLKQHQVNNSINNSDKLFEDLDDEI